MTSDKVMRIEHNFDLKPYNTFKISSIASAVYFPETIDEFVELLKTLDDPVILGGGSNVLLSSAGIKQPVILTNKLNVVKLKENIVTAQAGTKTGALARFAFKNELSGFEFLAPIPASVGGAVFMNAAAHNQAISDTFLSAKLFDLETKKIVEFNKDKMGFDYRKSALRDNKDRGKFIFLEGKFELEHKNPKDIRIKMAENFAMRKKNQPAPNLPNAGSIFKNPKNASAGALIDKIGLRGEKIGGAQIYKKHANFIINTGYATSFDVLELMFLAYNKVKSEFKTELEPEIIFIGNFTGNSNKEKIWKS